MPSLPQGRWRFQAEAGRRKPRRHKRERMRRRDFQGSIARGEPPFGERGAGNRQVRGNRPPEAADGEAGRFSGRTADPERGPGRARARRGFRRKRRGFGRTASAKGDLRGFGLEASPGSGGASCRGGCQREAAAGLPAFATRRDRRGAFGLLPRPRGTEQGLTALLRSPGSARGASRRAAIPKPPSERWPRHPATAVKAGTSGGRWRRRPPLRFARLVFDSSRHRRFVAAARRVRLIAIALVS